VAASSVRRVVASRDQASCPAKLHAFGQCENVFNTEVALIFVIFDLFGHHHDLTLTLGLYHSRQGRSSRFLAKLSRNQKMPRINPIAEEEVVCGFRCIRAEAQKCLKLAGSNELEIHFTEKEAAGRRLQNGRHLDCPIKSKHEFVRRNRTFRRHNEIEVVLLEKGKVGYMLGTEVFWPSTGRLSVFWGAIPHTPVSIIPGTVLNWVTIPFSQFMEWALPQAFTYAILDGKVLSEPDHQDASTDVALFARWRGDLEKASGESRKIVQLECEARLRRLAQSAIMTSHKKVRPAHAECENSSRVEAMVQFIASHYSERLRTAEIAAQVGLHPNYAAALFRRVSGMSILNYVSECRIYHAQRLLITTDQKILTIALGAGFGSAARFYYTFKKTCGQSPQAYRQSLSRCLLYPTAAEVKAAS